MRAMRSRLLPWLLLLFASAKTQAQRQFDLGVSAGVTQYYGDLGNYDGAVQWNSTKPALAITVREFIKNPKRYVTRSVNAEARISWHRLQYNETAPVDGRSGTDLRNFRRGLNFRNDLIGASGHMVMNWYRDPWAPLAKQRYFMFFYMGAGVYYGRPKADLFMGDAAEGQRYHYWSDGTIRDAAQSSGGGQVVAHDGQYETDLYAWNTEGGGGPVANSAEQVRSKNPSPVHLGIPMGMGVRYLLGNRMTLSAEYGYIYFFTDRLDDVSERYATYEEIASAFPGDAGKQETARYVSDPGGYSMDERQGLPTSRRGNPGMKDYLGYLNIELSCTMGKNRQGFGPNNRHKLPKMRF
jgi:hypothetical protein